MSRGGSIPYLDEVNPAAIVALYGTVPRLTLMEVVVDDTTVKEKDSPAGPPEV